MADKNNGSKSTSSSSNMNCSQSPKTCINSETPPTSAVSSPHLSPFEVKTCKELCVADENLPSRNISELWQKPLKLSKHLRKSNSPSVQFIGRKKNQHTPNRKNVLPPTKLVFDHLDSDESYKLPRIGYRRSMSLPGETCSNGGTTVYNPKRLKLVEDEKSPYEDMINRKSALKESDVNVQSSSTTTLTPAVRRLFSKSQSDTAVSAGIKTAVDKIEKDPTLIGDASTSYILPFKVNGKHPDLKEISAETLAKLIEAKEDYYQVSFKIIDCRYPYEFAGGHIIGAVNLYTKLQIERELLDCKFAVKSPSIGNEKKDIREILIFHCEFSSHRAPILCRHLRHVDRTLNASSYPLLFYPELYVLYGGYKNFFEKFPHLCHPQSYVLMKDLEHVDEYRRYKSETKL